MRTLCLTFIVSIMPTLLYAQAAITGVVRDASGGVLPGVTVEASSPALIEKVRVATTDGTGQYRIVDLRPGTYAVAFTLPGFSVVRREGIELTGSLTAQVNAELRVGGIEETITVTGDAPTVDVQSVRRQTTVDNEVIGSIPSARAYGAIMNVIPSVMTQTGAAADVQIAPNMTVFGGAGGRGNEGRLQVDGLGTGAPLNGGGVSTYIADIGNAQEVTFTTSGGLGEAEVGGPALSVVPRTGGNTFAGQVYVAGVNDTMVGSNYTDELRAAGLATPGQLEKLWDVNVGVGGPILRDRLWFYGTYRDQGNYRSIPGIFPNRNAGDPSAWRYEADTSRQAQGAESWRIATLRLTLQASPSNKFNFYWDEQIPCNGAAYFGAQGCREQPAEGAVVGVLGLGGLSATTSPETSGYLNSLQRVQQVTWTSPATNRLLLEAGLGTFLARWGPQDQPGNPTRDLIRVQEQCAAGCPDNGGIPGLNYRSANWNSNWSGAYRWRASSSYVTGSHGLKIGYQGAFFVEDDTNFWNTQALAYRVSNGVPNQFSQTLNPFTRKSRTAYSAVYAEEQWTRGRFTVQGALRFDHAWSYFPEQQVGPHRFLPSEVVFPKQDGANYKDLSPRAGLAWDVFGTGRTAVKLNIGRYLEPASNSANYTAPNPTNRIVTQTDRSWIDVNGNFTVDCDLQDMRAQDLRSAAGDVCGAGQASFGRPVFANTFDPELLEGWFVRPDDWGFGASIQQEIIPRVSLEVGYFRRWLGGFTATDNRAVSPQDFTRFDLTAPNDPRLPGGGGYRVSGLYNVNPALFAQTDNFVTRAENFGEWSQVYNGVLFNLNARLENGLTVQGGVNTGSTVVDFCEVREALPEMTIVGGPNPISPTNPYCRNAPGFITRVTGLATYTVPRVDVLLSTTFRSDQGAPLAANYNVPSSVVSAAIGRPVAGGVANLQVNLIEPGQVWGDRVNEIDIRVAKILQFGRVRTNVGLDIYNLLNSNAVLTYNQTFVPGGTWLAPTSVLTPRFVKFSAEFDF